MPKAFDIIALNEAAERVAKSILTQIVDEHGAFDRDSTKENIKAYLVAFATQIIVEVQARTELFLKKD